MMHLIHRNRFAYSHCECAPLRSPFPSGARLIVAALTE